MMTVIALRDKTSNVGYQWIVISGAALAVILNGHGAQLLLNYGQWCHRCELFEEYLYLYLYLKSIETVCTGKLSLAIWKRAELSEVHASPSSFMT